MKEPERTTNQTRPAVSRISAAFGLAFVIGLLFATPAWASYEQVQTFAGGKASSPIESAVGMAVNVSGAGGVPAGTIYVVTGHEDLVRYTEKGEFIDRTGIMAPLGVAIDQASGNVYLLLASHNEPGEFGVEVRSPDGSKSISSFGERGRQSPAPGETISEGPGKLHLSKGIAVDESGTVYVSDGGFAGAGEPGGQQNRVMVFKPESPGDFEHYVYTGQENDIAVSKGEARRLALDNHDNLHTAEDGGVYEFALSEPKTPSCELQIAKGGLTGMTVDPESGEVFYDSSKDGKGHQLACNGEGEFVQTGEFSIAPKPSATFSVEALAFNPAFAYEASRPPGTLYAASYEGEGYIFAQANEFPPAVISESVSRVTTTTARLSAQINPRGASTSYAFQYLTDAAYEANEPGDRFAGASETPLGGAVLGGGQSPLAASVALSGLLPDSGYHYRAIATSHCSANDKAKVCEDVGADRAFRTFPAEAPGLADKRAYELVSPADKHGGEVYSADPGTASCGGECKPGAFLALFPMLSSPDGEAVAYEGSPFSFSGGALQENEYLSKRTEAGWQTTTLSPALQGSGLRQGYKAFSPDLSQGLLYQVDPPLSPEAPSGYADLYAQDTANPLTLGPLLHLEPPNRPAGQSFALVYAGASRDFSRFFFEANDALTEETAFSPEAVDGGALKNDLYEWTAGQLRLVNVDPGNAETVPGAAFGSPNIGNTVRANFSHAISDDGSRVFWTSAAGQVYVRENAESTKAIPGPGKFLTASADGSRVLLADGHLFNVDDLVQAPVDLTQGKGGFQGILGQSEDLSRVYFIDTAALAGENAEHKSPAEGEDNLYAWEEGTTVFVATLLPQDGPAATSRGDWAASPVQRTAEASPDGGWVAFLSKAPLSGYDNTGPCTVISGTGKFIDGPCKEAYLYDSATAKLICASCNPSGARPLGNSNLRLIEGAEGSAPQPRYLTDTGRLYFDSQDALSPFDTNSGEVPGHAVEDVYQYEPEGVGTCKRQGGCVSLISAGHEAVDSNFLAIDETGANVFFTSRDELVLKDRDELVDLYDAREGGGIPSETETARTECQGEACQPAAIVPNDPTPGSSTFEGSGNVDEKKQSRKHKHKRHAKKHKGKHAHKRAAKHNRGGAK